MQKKWYTDKYIKNCHVRFRVKKFLFQKKTKFQKIEIFDLFDYGKSLVIDGIAQSAEKDEWVYHESLIHPALILQPVNKKLEILVLGAGEGATLRELLKYKNVKRIAAVDIDLEAVKIFKKFFPKMHQESFDDKRVNLVIDSAENFLKKTEKKYDIIFSDISDFTFFNLGSKENKSQINFYKLIFEKLDKNGIFVMHTYEFDEIDYEDHFKIKRTVEKVFPKTYSYRSYIPFFTAYWGFLISSPNRKFNPLNVSSKIIQERMRKQKLEKKLKYFSPDIFKAIFTLPPFLKKIENKI